MARVTTRTVTGWRTCARPRIVDSASWADDVVLEEDCPHYLESQPCELLEELVEWTFRDGHAQSTAGMDVDMVERSTTHLKPADGDRSCAACGFPESNFSLEPRPKYMSRSDQSQDELRRRSMQADKRQAEQVDAATRQALALEALARQGEENGRVAALERELAELRAMLAGEESSSAKAASEGGSEEHSSRAKPKAKTPA